jgi:hypothetical protein
MDSVIQWYKENFSRYEHLFRKLAPNEETQLVVAEQ